ncbi:MAG TPA: DMT family transporter [Terriglobia bacterium]|nr:DMT family transporter [Terriglobia bacterium]
MPRWLSFSLITIALFGVWGFVSTVITKDVGPLTVQFLSTIGLLPVALILGFSKNLRKGTGFAAGIMFATLTGVLGGSGNVALYKALQIGGEGSVIVPITGMYPLVTVILARFLLKEKLNRIQTLGIGLALVAIYLFSPRESLGATVSWKSAFSVWMLYSLLALLLFGVACITMKFATRHISDELSTIFYTVGYVLLAIVIIATGSVEWNVSMKNWGLGILVGLLMNGATLTLFVAYRWGKASIVTPLTALYPLITVLLAGLILKEHFDAIKVVAIGLALTAGLALSVEGRTGEVVQSPREA